MGGQRAGVTTYLSAGSLRQILSRMSSGHRAFYSKGSEHHLLSELSDYLVSTELTQILQGIFWGRQWLPRLPIPILFLSPSLRPAYIALFPFFLSRHSFLYVCLRTGIK